jgi:hypothetical protein
MAGLLRRKGEGGRRIYVWHLAMLAHAEGVDFSVALERIVWWNNKFSSPPLSVAVIEEKLREVYEKPSRGPGSNLVHRVPVADP